MSKSGAGLLLGMLIAVPALSAQTAAPPAGQPTVSAATGGSQNDQQLLQEFRNDLQSVETDVLAKGLSLTTEEATKFWPVFQKFQKEQQAVMDAQLGAVKTYAEHYATLTDADSQAYVKSLLERDQKIHDLRVKYLAEFGKVLPPGKAARAVHISRRLGLAAQLKLATQVPLVR